MKEGEDTEGDGSSSSDDSVSSTSDEASKQVSSKEKLRVKAMEGQQQQAMRVNAARGKDFKAVLEVGDICLIRTDKTTRAATDKGAICVKICSIKTCTSPTSGVTHYKYKVCTREGYLQKFQHRSVLEFQEKLDAKNMRIDETKDGFLKDLSIQDASNRSNVLGGSNVCRCLTDCSISNTCGCNKLGNFCNTKCHGGRGKNLLCNLCLIE